MAEAWLVFDAHPQRRGRGRDLRVPVPARVAVRALGGTIADRFNRRKLMLITESAAAVLAIVLWLIVLTDVVQVWMVFASRSAWGW